MATKMQLWMEATSKTDVLTCITWPFSRSPNGRGVAPINGRLTSAPRAMCWMAHGAPPTSRHHAAHVCGNGHLGCVNPKHLRWATAKENESHKLAHGTLRRGTTINTNVLSELDVKAIRVMLAGMSGVDVAKIYGVTPAAISSIKTRKNWAWLK